MKSAKKGGVEAAKRAGKSIDVIAVTILTSLAQEDLRDIFYYPRDEINSSGLKPYSGVFGGVGNLVLHLAELAKISGLDGVVCSGYESLEIKNVLGDNFKTIVPGIRLAGGGYAAEVQRDAGAAIAPKGENIKGAAWIDDQKRVMTPSMAFNSKADYIVVGREITASNDPVTALKAIYNDIERFAERT